MEEKVRAFPRSYSTQNLKDEVDRLGNMSPNNPMLGPGYFAKASLGLIELQGRENRKIARVTLGIALLALSVSAYAAWLTKIQTRPVLDEYARIRANNKDLCSRSYANDTAPNSGSTCGKEFPELFKKSP